MYELRRKGKDFDVRRFLCEKGEARLEFNYQWTPVTQGRTIQMHYNQSYMMDGRCGPDLYSMAMISLALFVAVIFNILHIFILYRTPSVTEPLLRIQSLLLLSVSFSSLVACTTIIPMVFTSHSLADENANCDLLKKFTAIFWLAPQSCNFISCIVLTLYRYATCMFPLTCESVMTHPNALISIICTWLFSYLPISMGTLLDSKPISGSIVYPLYKYPAIIFSLFYFFNLLFLVVINFHMWLLGYIAYRKDRKTASSLRNHQDVDTVRARRSRLKAAFVSFLLPVKNILLFLPPIAVECFIATGSSGASLLLTQFIWGPIPAVSHILDPIICIFLVKRTKHYLFESVLSILNPVARVVRPLFRAPNSRPINAVVPVES